MKRKAGGSGSPGGSHEVEVVEVAVRGEEGGGGGGGGMAARQQELDAVVEEVRRQLKDIRKDQSERQSIIIQVGFIPVAPCFHGYISPVFISILQESFKGNKEATERQMQWTKDLVNRPPKFNGEWYPLRIPKPAEAQVPYPCFFLDPPPWKEMGA